MLFRQIIAVAVAGFSAWACGSGPSKEAVNKAEKDVMAVHDALMNRMGDEFKLTKLLRRRADSLDKLTPTDASATVRIAEEKAQISRLTLRLKEADSLMYGWMNGYKMDTLPQLRPDQALAYLKQQQTKIDDVNQKFNGSIGQAQAYLKK